MNQPIIKKLIENLNKNENSISRLVNFGNLNVAEYIEYKNAIHKANNYDGEFFHNGNRIMYRQNENVYEAPLISEFSEQNLIKDLDDKGDIIWIQESLMGDIHEYNFEYPKEEIECLP